MARISRVVLLAAVVVAAAAAPAAECDRPHYDQRQNGTENYRLNIDGVVIAVAPADALLSAASDIDLSDLLSFDDLEGYKPTSSLDNKPAADPKPQDGKPTKPEVLSDVSIKEPADDKEKQKEAHPHKQEKAKRLKLRLMNMLMPLLRKNRHH